ncbi:hypothetical protein CIPAW_14G080500 [Carya illinoinensis]|uniref:Uncharacterized protein n=1 Tax=Carya illinoinensis TaxID=32201 RepID=A0A8T1NKF7_CARIL|nr:hypothetical protein CIPAW_14G080500 [Carya illinoinensis]
MELRKQCLGDCPCPMVMLENSKPVCFTPRVKLLSDVQLSSFYSKLDGMTSPCVEF